MDRSANQNQDHQFDERLVALYPELFGLALRLCRNNADAHDLVQSAFERGLRCRDLFRSGESPDRWMSTILRRIFVDDYRARRRRARLSLLDDHEAVTAPAPEATPAWADFTLEDVQRALLFVDQVSREIYSLFALERLGQHEIARRLAIPQKTVATRIFRTRAKLRKILESGAYRRHLALVPPANDPSGQPPAPGSTAGRPVLRSPRTRVAAMNRRARTIGTGIG
ncbi:MAG TPA: RNA polymerase sigma factor [Polyangia bacterium]|jgi:RNA polymerase sigma-70 factor (ECF subfamily)|nr:RNA polymerase sigma factor [Polyangia bacterium]